MGDHRQRPAPVQATQHREAPAQSPVPGSAGAANGAAPGGGPGNAARAQAVAGPADNVRFNLRLQLPGRPADERRELARADALTALGRYRDALSAHLEGGAEGYRHHMQIQADQPVAAAFSDLMAWQSPPPVTLFEPARAALERASGVLRRGDVLAAHRALQDAARAIDQAYRTFLTYRDGAVEGANRMITVLEVTEVVGAVAATVATGGLGGGTLLGSAAVAGATAGGYGVVSATAGQASEQANGLRQGFDVGAILRRGAVDAVTGFVGALTGGALSRYLQRGFGSYLGTASDDLLRELGHMNGMTGPLPRDFFLTRGQRFIAEFFSSVGTSPLTTAVSTVTNRLLGGTPRLPSGEEFVRQVLQDMVQGGILTVFTTFITHRMPAARPRTAQSAHEAVPAAPREPAPGASRPVDPAGGERRIRVAPDANPNQPRPDPRRPEPSVVITDPEMAAGARPATPEEAAAVQRQPANPEARPAAAAAAPVEPATFGQFDAHMDVHRDWQTAITALDANPATRPQADALIAYRRWVVEQIRTRFEGQPAGTASENRTSDVDINMMGDNAGANFEAASLWLRENVGPEWNIRLRLDLLVDAGRSTTYRGVMDGPITPAHDAMVQNISAAAETRNLARMLQHAAHAETPQARSAAEARIEGLMRTLGLSDAQCTQIRQMAAEAPNPSRRSALTQEIDALLRQYRAATDPSTRLRLAQEITLKQVEVNFHMGEAYIGPGAIRQTVEGQRITPQEAYNAALSHLEMYHHQVGQQHGNEVAAGRGYELFKYVSRFAETVEHAGLSSPQSTYFRRLGEYIYRANRDAHKMTAPPPRTDPVSAEGSAYQDRIANQRGSGRDQGNEAHARGRADQAYYVTDPHAVSDAQIQQLLREFDAFVLSVLPRMRTIAQPSVRTAQPAVGGAAAAATSAANSRREASP